MKKGIILLGIVMMTSGLVACGGGEVAKAKSIPQYFKLEANKEVSKEGFEEVYSKTYDINNDGLFDDITIGKKGNEKKLFIETAEKGEMLNVVDLEEGLEKIKEIRDSDGNGIEEIILEGKDGEKEYVYDSNSKGFVLK